MVGRLSRGALVGTLFLLAAGIWPARANVDPSRVKVTKPAAGTVIAGSYGEDGAPSGFSVTVQGQAETTCSQGWQSVKITITGPSGYRQVFDFGAPSATSWSGSRTWDTEPLRNGDYVIRLDATEKKNIGINCNGQSGSAQVSVKVANPPKTPTWAAAPASANGAAPVSLSWKRNTEPDLKEYRIVRTGPDGERTAALPASACSSGSVCTAQDSDFEGDYSGTYTYRVFAVRSAPAGAGVPCAEGSSARCVVSAGSDPEAVTLAAPPSPTPSPSQTPSATPSSRPSPRSSAAPRVLSFGSSRPSTSEFYTGSYSKTLPYDESSVLLPASPRALAPRGQAPGGEQVVETPPNYRTVMVPVAGGLLALLSAAHVRRLLTHI